MPEERKESEFMNYREMDLLDKAFAIRYRLCPMIQPIAQNCGLSLRESNKAPFELEFHSFRTATLVYQVVNSTTGFSFKEKEEIFDMAIFHDIGKAQSKMIRHWASTKTLTGEEFEEMKQHISEESMIASLIHGLGIDENTFPAKNKIITTNHHYRINGRGYPVELPKEAFGVEIDENLSMVIQLIGVVDAIEAISSDLRLYRHRHGVREKRQPVTWWKLTLKERSNLLDAIERVTKEACEGFFDKDLVSMVSHCFINKQPKDPWFLPEVIGNYLSARD
uniref:HD domain-containing protein n=1 Tax=candidate division CPR3 bacterium TaxID=2268181 RepID=A0A7C4M0H2_UNCC3